MRREGFGRHRQKYGGSGATCVCTRNRRGTFPSGSQPCAAAGQCWMSHCGFHWGGCFVVIASISQKSRSQVLTDMGDIPPLESHLHVTGGFCRFSSQVMSQLNVFQCAFQFFLTLMGVWDVKCANPYIQAWTSGKIRFQIMALDPCFIKNHMLRNTFFYAYFFRS